MLRACSHHGFTELTQVDTFYNGLNENDQDSLNAATGGNLLSKTTREALNIIENKSKVRYSRNKSNVSRMNTTSRESVVKLAPPGFAPVQNNGQNRFNQNQGQGNNFNWGNNFHDALFFMLRFAPTIRNLLMNKETLLELAKIPLNENCSAMLLKKLPEKLGDPGKFSYYQCNFLGMDISQLGRSWRVHKSFAPCPVWK
ncbi:hypothetical protein Tco_0628760 [Tanacetum coccineum]|uniref:Reverse transcriptase domain-containing protein n=1 Tax=Tanacetum coccineum TaxID=301880 RepID=A0ABQ4WRG3_9ASTR